MKRQFMLIMLVTLVLPACDRQSTPPDAGGLSREQFIELFVSLRNARKSASSPADFEEKKRQLLAEAKVTEEQFKSFGDAHAEDLPFMAAVWDSIQNRLDRGDTAQQAH